jgi:hypothetical protein
VAEQRTTKFAEFANFVDRYDDLLLGLAFLMYAGLDLTSNKLAPGVALSITGLACLSRMLPVTSRHPRVRLTLAGVGLVSAVIGVLLTFA